jgi:hypothetical protein
MANQASQQEVQDFIERERLYGRGCLLASTLMTPGAALWTLDQHLAVLARRFRVDYARLLNLETAVDRFLSSPKPHEH